MNTPKQLTDDGVRSIIVDLVDFLDRHPLICPPIEGEAYDWLVNFMEEQLEPYSNGYVNFN